MFTRRWFSANSPLQPPSSSLCHLPQHLIHPCGPSPICHDCMFEGGPPESKGMPCHLEIECCSLLIMGTSGHAFMGGFNRKNGLGFYSCSLVPTWWLILYASPMGSPLLATIFRSGSTWENSILVAWSQYHISQSPPHI